ncbi:serine/threonine-protein kinase [Marinicella litoralis]|uniref:non-specific serine/threonine protein kinase n=1 Tax=Marinicella litoralis TaxID=644220 RepID=A0A4R6XME6_9GAMM|nr:serine/threonine-protein kinase [Marinicella litoralis]TDR19539.1 tetratricopeptide repeat protein [Marinicella litoralis]
MAADSDKSINIGDGQTQIIEPTGKMLKIGTTLIGRFLIEAQIGEGGFGQVYKATDLHLNASVAIKLLHNKFISDEAALNQFKNEILILRQLSHQNILRVYEYYQESSHCFITMDWIDGELLSEKIEQGSISFTQVKQYSEQIMDALDYAQMHEVCHRDLKPENILIDGQGRLYILDFGMAVFTESSAVKSFGGTPFYCAPEYLQDNVINNSTDFYSVGLIIYEMCCRKLPYKASDMATLIVEKQQPIKKFPCTDKSLKAFKQVVLQLTTPLARPRTELLDSTEISHACLLPENGHKSKTTFWILILATVLMFCATLIWIVFKGDAVDENLLPDSSSYQSIILLPFSGSDSGDGQFSWVNRVAPEILSNQLSLQPTIRLVPVDRINEVIQSLGFKQPLNQKQQQVLSELLKAEYLVKGKYAGAGQNQILLNVDLVHIVGSQLLNQNLIDAVISDAEVYESLVGTSEKLLEMFEIKENQESEYVLTQKDLNLLAKIKVLRAEGNNEAIESALLALLSNQSGYVPSWDHLYQFYLDNGQFNKAEEVLTQVITITQPGQYYHNLFRARLNDLNGNPEEAEKIYQSVLLQKSRDESLLFEVAQFYIRNEDYESAQNKLKQLLELAPNHVAGLYELSKISIRIGDIQKAIDDYLVRSLVSANKLNDARYKGLIYNAFGVAYQRLGEIDLAIDNYNNGLEIRLKIDDVKGAVTSMSNLAALYAVKGEYAKAEALLQQGVAMLDDSGNDLDTSIMINKLGVLAEEQGLYKEALTHYQNALNLRLNLDEKWLQAESMNNVGFIFFLMTQLDHAVIYWQQAEKIYTEIGDMVGLLQVNQNMAQLQLRKGSLNEAFQSFESSLHEALNLKVKEEQFVAKANLAKISFLQGNFRHAISELLTVLEDLKSRDDVRGQIEYGLLLSEWYFIIGDIEQAENTLLKLETFTASSMSLVQQQKFKLLLLSLTGELNTLDLDELLSHHGLPEYEVIQNYLFITRQFLSIDIDKAKQLLTYISTINVKLYKLAYLELLELKVLYSGLVKDRKNYSTYLDEATKLSKDFPIYWRNYHLEVLKKMQNSGSKLTDDQRQQILLHGWEVLIKEIPVSARQQFTQQQQGIYLGL